MASKYQAPRGTFDVLPKQARSRARVERSAAAIFARAGYEPIATPAFEDTELFVRGVGRSTDIVNKEMFSFEDKGGRSITLRPEGTAPICRAYLEHGMHKLAQPVKLSYLGPFFRHERPQAGRYRQFHQVGLECIGSDSPLADAEAIMLLAELLAELGVPGVALRLGSLGSLDSRRAYLEELKAHLHAHEGELSKEVRERIDVNPLRAFDADDEGTRGVMASAPTIVERLEGEDAEHFAEVRALLDAAGVEYAIDPSLVRGLDYYTRTIFSFVCDALGAQSEIGGGGRYDGLIEQLGGPVDPGGRLGGGDRADPAGAGRGRGGAGTRRLRRRGRRGPARPGDGAGRRAAHRRPLGRARHGRARPQGAAQARRPDRRPPARDLGGGRLGPAARHGVGRAAPGRDGESDRGGNRVTAGGASPQSEFPALRPNGFRDAWCGQVLGDRVDSEVRVAGWVHRRRDHGGLIFIDLRDRTGLVQLVFNPDAAEGSFELAHKLRAEDVLSASGTVVRRSEETVNRELPTGEVELRVADAELLADAETPPFQIEGFSGEVGEDTRLRYRYLDLRREQMHSALALRHRVTAAMREFLDEEGFLDIETPVLTRSTPEGARDFLVPSRLQHGSFYALPQSPQLFKQLLMVAGLERYYQVARCFRDEDLRADRQPDFTQLDIEMSFVDLDDVIEVNERLLAHVFDRVGGPSLQLPMERLPYDEAISRFGTDRPDTRFGLELVDLADALAETEFKVFRSVIDSGGAVRGLNAGRREMPRSALDGLISRAQELGAKGLVWAFREGDGWRSPTAKFLSAEELSALNEKLGAEEGDLLLVVADRPKVANAVLAQLRLDLAAEFDLIPADADSLLWIVDWPLMEERDDGGWDPLHHPFTAPAGDFDPKTRAASERSPTTSSGTARRWAAARFVSATPPYRARSSPRWESMPPRRRPVSAFSSKRFATAPPRTAASPTGWTGSSSGWPAPNPFAM